MSGDTPPGFVELTLPTSQESSPRMVANEHAGPRSSEPTAAVGITAACEAMASRVPLAIASDTINELILRFVLAMGHEAMLLSCHRSPEITLIPRQFIDPLLGNLMQDPVRLSGAASSPVMDRLSYELLYFRALSYLMCSGEAYRQRLPTDNIIELFAHPLFHEFSRKFGLGDLVPVPGLREDIIKWREAVLVNNPRLFAEVEAAIAQSPPGAGRRQLTPKATHAKVRPTLNMSPREASAANDPSVEKPPAVRSPLISRLKPDAVLSLTSIRPSALHELFLRAISVAKTALQCSSRAQGVARLKSAGREHLSPLRLSCSARSSRGVHVGQIRVRSMGFRDDDIASLPPPLEVTPFAAVAFSQETLRSIRRSAHRERRRQKIVDLQREENDSRECILIQERMEFHEGLEPQQKSGELVPMTSSSSFGSFSIPAALRPGLESPGSLPNQLRDLPSIGEPLRITAPKGIAAQAECSSSEPSLISPQNSTVDVARSPKETPKGTIPQTRFNDTDPLNNDAMSIVSPQQLNKLLGPARRHRQRRTP